MAHSHSVRSLQFKPILNFFFFSSRIPFPFMATVISAVATAGQYRYDYGRLFQRPAGAPSRGFPWRCFAKQRWRRLMVMKMKKKKSEEDEMVKKLKMSVEEKMRKKKAEREGYLIAAIVSSFGITSMAAIAVYYRFSSQIMEVLCFHHHLLLLFLLIKSR